MAAISPERTERPKSAEHTARQLTRSRSLHLVKFGSPLEETLYNNQLPVQLVELLLYIAQEGVCTTDLFRRHGSNSDVRQIIFDLTSGRVVKFTHYNFYTLATVVKIFLLKLPNGLFGEDVERRLTGVADLPSRAQQYEAIHSTIARLPVSTQQLLTLLLGTWFRMVSHSEFNTMSSEAVANSVVTCLFHSLSISGDDDVAPTNNGRNGVRKAIRVMQILIDDFSVVEMLGRSNVRFFAAMTRSRNSSIMRGMPVNEVDDSEVLESTPDSQLLETSIEIRLHDSTPASVGDQLETKWCQMQLNSSSISAPEVNQAGARSYRDLLPPSSRKVSTSLSRIDDVQRRQMMRMKKRSSWFLTPPASVGHREDVMTRSFELRRRTLGTRSSSAKSTGTRNTTLFHTQLSDTMDYTLRRATDESDKR